MTTAERAEHLASWREFCECTADEQHDPRCDGTRCVGQEKAIAAALSAADAAPASVPCPDCGGKGCSECSGFGRMAAPASGVTEEMLEALPVDQWPIEIDEDVLIYVVHPNAQWEKDEAKRREQWECWCVGRWIDHNKGGWTWHGMCGTVTHVAPLPARPVIRGEGK